MYVQEQSLGRDITAQWSLTVRDMPLSPGPSERMQGTAVFAHPSEEG